jgi:hypothetical protein
VALDKLLFDVAAFRHVLFNFFLIGQVESDCAEDLLQGQRREVRLDSLWRITILEVVDDDCQRHTAADEIETPMATLNVVLGHSPTYYTSLARFRPLGARRAMDVPRA